MKRKIIRLCVFLLGFVWLIIFANTFLIKTDTYARLTLAELQERDDIQVAFVGSSIVRDHFNAEMISEQTGFTCFSARLCKPISPSPRSFIGKTIRNGRFSSSSRLRLTPCARASKRSMS